MMMRSPNRWLSSFVTVGVLAAALALPTPAFSAERPVTLAEVNVTKSAHALAAGDVRELAESAIDRTAWPTGRRGSLVSVSVVSVEARPSANGSSLSCLVSAALRDSRTGNVYAVVESRATREQRSVSDADERVTINAALEGAISKLPDALH